MTSTGIASSTMLLAGIGIPVMAALNAGLGVSLGNPVQAAVGLFAVGLICSLIVLWLTQVPVQWDLGKVPAHLFLGGLLVAFYVLGITYVVPVIGVGRAIALVLLGQIVSSAVIDHFGWLGAPQATMTFTRLLGLLAFVAGIVLTRQSHAP